MSTIKKLSTAGAALATATATATMISTTANAFSEDVSYQEMEIRKYCMKTVVNDMKGIVKEAFVKAKTENGKLSYTIKGHFNFIGSNGSRYTGSLKISTHSKTERVEVGVKLNTVVHNPDTTKENEQSDTQNATRKMADQPTTPGGLDIEPPPTASDAEKNLFEFLDVLKGLPGYRRSTTAQIEDMAISNFKSCLAQDIRSASNDKTDDPSTILANRTSHAPYYTPG